MKPLLFLSDSPDLQTGLARIGRDLACFVARDPSYRVGYMGLGGSVSRTLPFPQYVIQRLQGEWGQGSLQRVWHDFAGSDTGAIFTIWDATRLLWFARPNYVADSELSSFLSAGHFQRWGYIPLDSTGPSDKLTALAAEALLGYDRLLAYTSWGEQLIRRSIGDAEASKRHLTWLPHGINEKTFIPRDRKRSRAVMGPSIHDGDFVVGSVGTNQARKDWGLVFAAVAGLRQKIKKLRLWVHIDLDERYWSIPALANDFGLADILTVTHSLSDEVLSYYYSACDVTLHPGLGEGFGYPAIESLACGVPAIHGDYAGGQDVLRQCGMEKLLVPPRMFRLDSLHNCVRPVFEPADWADKVLQVQNERPSPEESRAATSHLWWVNLWPSCWQPYFEHGLEML